jgi:CheY-like chemotaxis protein
MNVLVIDDDPTIRRMLTFILEQAGFSVRSSYGVTDALKLVQEDRPDLICCDLMMPEVNGLDFLALRQNNPVLAAIPVITISGAGEEKLWAEAKSLGANASVSKPFGRVKLLEMVEMVMNQPHYESIP